MSIEQYVLDPLLPNVNSILTERELMARLDISRTTLWRLRQQGLPSISVGRGVRYDYLTVRAWLSAEGSGVFGASGERPTSKAASPTPAEASGSVLPPCHWRPSVALDPKHRPQTPSRPSSTVRREWWRFPQEAHLLDLKRSRYRRLRASEVGALQDFPSGWASAVAELDQIRGYGNAVPPSLAEHVIAAMGEHVRKISGVELKTSIELCAGFGGLALGAARALSVEHRALLEIWPVACRVLRTRAEWPVDAVIEGDVREFDWDAHRDEVSLLTGGPPCQPWSSAGLRRGSDDERDLLGETPDFIRRLRPRAFVFENVPGLLQGENYAYGHWIAKRLAEPGEGLRYGVAFGVLNAADFGVPQVRRRVFLIGIRDGSWRDVHRIFDRIFAGRTHGDPRRVLPDGCRPWRTTGEALPGWADVEEGWRQWYTPSSLAHASRAAIADDVKQLVRGNREAEEWDR